MNESQAVPITGGSIIVTTWIDRRLMWLSRRWLLAFNLFVALYVGLPFAAPALMKVGATGPARVLYTMYSPFCHQLAFRSWFLFGEQSVYPRAAAGLPGESLQQATGVDENDLFASRAFIGDEQVGYKVAFCQRDVAIYAGILLAGLAYGLLRLPFRIKPLPWYLWALLGVAPIAIDGFSQLLSQYPYALLPWYRESTPLLRAFTGGLFGVMNVWFAYPYVEDSMKETAEELDARYKPPLTRANLGLDDPVTRHVNSADTAD